MISKATIRVLCSCCLAFALMASFFTTPDVFAQGREAEKADDAMAGELRHLETADPAADVTAAIARGDLRFLGIAGFTVTVPGVLSVTGQPSDKDNERLVASHGVRVVEGTSDDKAVLAFQLAAIGYAERYNRLLLQHLKLNR